MKITKFLLAGTVAASLLAIPAAAQASGCPYFGCGLNGTSVTMSSSTLVSRPTVNISDEDWYRFWAPVGTKVTVSIRDLESRPCQSSSPYTTTCGEVTAGVWDTFVGGGPILSPWSSVDPLAVFTGEWSWAGDAGNNVSQSFIAEAPAGSQGYEIMVSGSPSVPIYGEIGLVSIPYTITITASNGYLQWPVPGPSPVPYPTPAPTPTPTRTPTPPPPIPASVVAKPKCPDVVFIGARGSGEKANDHGGLGAYLSRMATTLKSKLQARGKTVSIIPLTHYTADSVYDLKPSASEIAWALGGFLSRATTEYRQNQMAKYDRSIKSGIIDAVATTGNACPTSKIVMAGYSQGAIAIHQAELRLPQNVLQRIAGTLLLGDGDRVANTRAHEFGDSTMLGKPSAGGEGIRAWLRMIPKRDVPSPSSTANICSAGDVVCDFNGSYLTNLQRFADGALVHTHYQNSLLDKAATWVAGKIR